ncbi:AraC family transcriptional regulator [Pedobacter psychroterrae]|uniref:AraC family transcriptional regulator n=1 Tax=Pedobacter psychroterrae TaxID=2530453 RepID=A0A4R0NKV4_9SPHI|nr:helix-turn-helix domain-containing protein [Pedobacter psychroterrae]TCD01412.1 AraC family transcriptional regulator [Pedobacter psychroterrae]
MHQSFALLFLALSAGSLFLAAFLLLTGVVQANHKANKWLGAFFFLLSLLLMELFLEGAGHPQPLLIQITEWPRWAIFPCLYVAVFTFVHPLRRPRLLLIHFLPAVIFIIFLTLGDKVQLPNWTGVIARYFFFAQGLVYGVLNLRILMKHQSHIRQVLADRASDLTWLRNFVYAPLVIAGVWLAFRQLPIVDGLLQLLCLGLSLYFVSAAFRQRDVYPGKLSEVEDWPGDVPNESTSARRLTPNQIAILKDRVTLLTDQHKPYLDPALNLHTLADKVGINTHELSLVLNQGFGMNFYAYINGLRAEEAIRLLKSGKYGRGEMEAVSIRAGFNSRTTFYAAIKKKKGEKPAGFLKKD